MNAKPDQVDREEDEMPFAGEEGQSLAEFSLILTLVAIVCIGALTALGGSISGGISGIMAGF